MFKKDFKKQYDDVKIIRFEQVDNSGLYQAYAEIDGKEVPFVTVNARTGYYHG